MYVETNNYEFFIHKINIYSIKTDSEIHISQLINSLQNAWYQDRFSEQVQIHLMNSPIVYIKWILIIF